MAVHFNKELEFFEFDIVDNELIEKRLVNIFRRKLVLVSLFNDLGHFCEVVAHCFGTYFNDKDIGFFKFF
jgi:hypothetical protein